MLVFVLDHVCFCFVSAFIGCFRVFFFFFFFFFFFRVFCFVSYFLGCFVFDHFAFCLFFVFFGTYSKGLSEDPIFSRFFASPRKASLGWEGGFGVVNIGQCMIWLKTLVDFFMKLLTRGPSNSLQIAKKVIEMAWAKRCHFWGPQVFFSLYQTGFWVPGLFDP